MKHLLPLIIVALAAGCASEAPAPVAAPSPSPSAAPEYLLHKPTGYTASKSYPLVLVFHGQPGAPEDMVKLTKFNDLADQKGFIVAYPKGLRDVAQVDLLIEELKGKMSIDLNRVHATGFSMGGSFTYDVAERLSGRFGSVAAVSSAGGNEVPKANPPSLLVFQGGADRIRQGFAATNNKWARSAGCGKATVTTSTMEDGPAHRHESACAGNAKLVIYDVPRMGHHWPAEATALIWDFFAAHPLTQAS